MAKQKKTSGAKYKPARNGGSGRPNNLSLNAIADVVCLLMAHGLLTGIFNSTDKEELLYQLGELCSIFLKSTPHYSVQD